MNRRRFLEVAGLSVVGLCSATARSVDPAPRRRRLALVIDSAVCAREEGCDRCVAACRETHNVPAGGDPAHEVKWIWQEPIERAFPSELPDVGAERIRGRRVLVLCNHCDNPPCVRVCPTGATWKRDDGLVMMDYHRCIGCRYCMAACPYGARSFNWTDPRAALRQLNPAFPTRTAGVVEKCSFCEERLARGGRPACVEACRQRALTFGDIEDPGSEPRASLRDRFALRRKAHLGTGPRVYYVV